MTQENILFRGGAGYIGSHTTFAFKEAGYEVVTVDMLNHRECLIIEVESEEFLEKTVKIENGCEWV